jgi:hypothetical protein
VKRWVGAVAGLALAAGALAAERPPQTQSEIDTVQSVHSALSHRDCELAISRLNDGLARQYPDVFMLAGWIYEEGFCVKPNWERAEAMYFRARDTGHHGGLLRLIAGYGAKGRDPAAALWWAQQVESIDLPEPCRMDQRLWSDPELFVATLKLWPGGRLAACVYTAAVAAAVAGQAQYPPTAIEFAMIGKVQMRFVPSTPAITWQTTEVELLQMGGVIDGDQARDRDSRWMQRSFENHLRRLGDQVLARYQRPLAVPTDWLLGMVFVFRQE